MVSEVTAPGVPAEATGLSASTDLRPEERPYRPGWTNLLVDWLQRLPVPTWLAYVGLAAIGMAVQSLIFLGQANVRPEDVLVQAFWAIVLPLGVWLLDYLATTAGSALDAFRPALAIASESDIARLHYELTTVPALGAAIILVFVAVLTPLYWVGDPVGSNIVGLSPIGLAGRYLGEVFFGALVLVLVYQSWRQLRIVNRIHSGATHVDLFRPAPLYAFSVFTSRAAIGIALVFIIPTMVAVTDAGASLTSNVFLWAPWITLGVVAAAAVFALPLREMHRRITAEKRRLQTEVGLRLEATMAAIHRAIDADEIVEAGKMDDTLHALISERDLVEKLPTLPWRPGTLGALVSAIVLPLGLFLVQRVLSQFLG
jgi:hypothetical protein